MSVQSEIDRIAAALDNTYAVLEGYGATMPEEQTSDNLAATAATVPASGCIVTTEGDGTAYTATVPGITELTAGVNFIMIPHVVSAAKVPTLNVNGLGAKNIRRRLSNSTVSTVASSTEGWLGANKPIRMMFDGTFWIPDFNRPNMADAYGTVSVVSGGTGKTAVTAGSYLVGNGTSALQEKTPTEVLADLTAVGAATTADIESAIGAAIAASY